jgi:flavin reductase (DIM6/NTAB) family NADH-FMN oxidoreductase RutF
MTQTLPTEHVTTAPSILYFGTPVVLISTENADGTPNHAPMSVESLALLTGANPVPDGKPANCRYEKDKYGAAGLHALASELVRPPRVAECPVQIEARVADLRLDSADSFVIVEATTLRVHADRRLVIDGTSHIDTQAWSPLVYNFRHYFGLGPRLGKARRAEY